MSAPDAKARTGLLLGFLAYASWGLLSPVGHRLLQDYEPLQLNAVRFSLAWLFLLPWLGFKGLRDSLRATLHPGIALANLLTNVSLALFLFALVRVEPAFATLGFYTTPLWTAILAAVVLKERVGRWFPAAIASLLIGGYLMLFGFARADGVDVLGMGLAVGSGVVWGLYTVVLRKSAPGIEDKPLIGSAFLWGTAFFVLTAWTVEGRPHLLVTKPLLGWMALYIAVPTIASFALFNLASRRTPAADLNVLVGAELAFTALFAWLLADQSFGREQLLGLAIVLVGVSAYLWSQRTPSAK